MAIGTGFKHMAVVLSFCAFSAGHVVLLQPSIGYVYPPQVVQGPPQPQDHEGYYYNPPPQPHRPGPSEHFNHQNQVQGPVPPYPYPYPAPGYGDGFPQEAECLLVASTGNSVSGELRLTQAAPGGGVRVTGTVYGLSPGRHGFHVHRDPDTADDCKAAGPHFNPHNQTHGGPTAASRHAGDLGNIEADGAGVASVDVVGDMLSLEPGAEGFAVGRAFVVHAKADDLGQGGDDESLRTGNAGARLACCVVTQRY
ncbi:Superoxide dismutase [Cu-Zn] [Gryllus bimaculatus]|nr:Superoxide dismutase [Cu-Zn] [Gryllus bimaculatus]